jgi:hypothetical protein
LLTEDGVESGPDPRGEGKLPRLIPCKAGEGEHRIGQQPVVKLNSDLVLEEVLPAQNVLPESVWDDLAVHKGPIVAAETGPVARHKPP